MGIYEFAGCVVSYEPLYGLLRRRMETYRSDTEGQPDITLDGTKEDYEKLRKQYPHLSIEECEYSCAGAEFYMKLLKHQGFMIHASAVEKEGKAYLFSAPSGTGKSTHAQLWRQTFKGEPIRIINDDKPAVCLQNGVFYACGTPFSGKTDKNENRKAPIQGLCMLHRGKTNKIQKIQENWRQNGSSPKSLFWRSKNMTVLVVGGGGREHALVRKIKESPRVDSVHCCPGNGGIAYDAVCHNVAAMDIDGVVALAKEIQADLVVVAPDDPLVAGMVDALNAAGFATFGPRANAAIIEGSKVFSKDLMQKYHIPTAEYRVFDDPRAAIEYITEKNEFPTVIKADGLALGKGVLIPETLEEAVAGVKEIMEDKVFGASGNHIVVEEFLTGPEVSVLAFTDGKCVRPMVSSMDHKRALDGDKGLNTGGMGTVSPNPYYTEAVAQQCMDTIFLPTIAAMNAEGRTFQGCLYFGLMLTPKGPKVIEYNCRFGDPETQVVLPLLESDLLTVMESTTNGTLDTTEVKFRDGAAACVILASGGYPLSYEKGKEISGLAAGQLDAADVTVYHAGTAIKDGKLVTNGGRVLGVTATANTLPEALKKAYAATESIHFDKLHKRSDIGARALAAME